MDLLEHQGKQLLRAAGLPAPRGEVAHDAAMARAAAERLGLPVAVKAQVRTGKRGKAGGIRVCATLPEVERATADILDMHIGGRPVECVLVEEGVSIRRELYAAIVLSRHERAPLLLLAAEGGMDVEELAAAGGDALFQTTIDPLLGLCEYQVRDAVAAARLPAGPSGHEDRPAGELAQVLRGMARAYRENDAVLLEVNPLAVTAQGAVVCLDAKVTLDDNAGFRRELVAQELQTGDGREVEARRVGLSFVSLDGDIGVIGNGAGLVMSTLDLIAAAGGRPANFCDVGGGARAEVIAKALSLVLAPAGVSTLLVSVFGGITRCDEVARGLVEALTQTRVAVPVFVRLAGNAASLGAEILGEAALPHVTVLATADQAVRAAVAAAAGRAEWPPAHTGGS